MNDWSRLFEMEAERPDLGGRRRVRAAVGMRLAAAVKVVLAAVVLLRAKAPCGVEKGNKEGKWF